MRRRATLALVAAALGTVGAPAAAAAAPTLSDGAVSPLGWSSASHAGVLWTQNDFGLGLHVPAAVEVNLAPDGSDSGPWQARYVPPVPLLSGPNFPPFPGVPVEDLEGRHQVRVVVPGVAGSPLALGTLQLDRTPPVVDGARFSVNKGVDWTFLWSHSDALSGLHPTEPIVAEMNVSPAGDEAGAWVPLSNQPPPGGADSHKFASLRTAGIPAGVYLARVRSIDAAGNAGVSPLGVVDLQPPQVSDVRIVQAPSDEDRAVRIAFAASDGAGTGVDLEQPALVYVRGGSSFIGFAPVEEGEVRAALPDDGAYELVIRVADHAGNLGESAPIAVSAEYGKGTGPRGPADIPATSRPDPVELFTPQRRPPLADSTRWAYSTARRFHARRGVRLSARVSAARTRTEWRGLLGTRQAGRYVGYTTFGGDVLLGPSVTAGLEDLYRARLRLAADPGAPLPSRLELDRMAAGLAVLLHETLHATGPRAREDFRLTRSGRAFEEGFTEAAAVDLLPAYVRSLGGPPRLRPALRKAVRRYEPAYPRHVGRARSLSTLATKRGWRTSAARNWRVAVADRWGESRWTLLARATGRSEEKLRSYLASPPGTRLRR